MNQLSNQEKWKVWMAFVLEAIVLGTLLYVCAGMQAHWGMVGIMLTEVILLLIALVPIFLFKTPLREVFPTAKVTGKEILGVILFAIGAWLLNMIMVGVSLCMIPDTWDEVIALNQIVGGEGGLLLSMITIAILPAICEECLHRGTMLSCLRGVKNRGLIICIMAGLFGLFHMSALRFLPTAALGAMLTYLMVKKNNILLPMLLHFFNNLTSVLIGCLSGTASTDTAALEAIDPSLVLGAYCVLGCFFPLFLTLGDRLICGQEHKKHPILTTLACVGLFVFGVVMILFNSSNM